MGDILNNFDNSFSQFNCWVVNFSLFGDWKSECECQSEPIFKKRHNTFELLRKHRSIIIFYVDSLISTSCSLQEIRLSTNKRRNIRYMNWYSISFFCFFERKSIIITTSSFTIERIASISDFKSICNELGFKFFNYFIAEQMFLFIII